jgi:hypothetical protein
LIQLDDWFDWGIGTSLAQHSNAFSNQEFKRHFVAFKDSRHQHLKAEQQRLNTERREVLEHHELVI